MSGHSKWSKIKRKKGAEDARRSNMYSRVVKEIIIAVKENGSGDPNNNARLRLAIANAKGVNMPKENVERAIKKALDSGSSALFQPTYEGYGPGGIAVFVECTTDNTNRSVANVRSIFNKRGGSISTSGSVEFLFQRKGIFIIDATGKNMEDLELELIDGGAEEVELDEENNEITVTVAFEDFGIMQKKLESLNIESKSATLERLPNSYTAVSVEDAKRFLHLIDALEEDDDVNQVFHNLEMTEEIAAALEE